MKTIYNFIILFTSFLAITSCSNEDEVFEAIEFETTGLSLTKSIGSENSFWAEVPSEGCVITFKAVGKNKNNGFLNKLKINGQSEDINKDSIGCIVQKDWGKIERVSTDPHETKITLYPNNSDNTRNFELFFGIAYKTSNILVSQPNYKEDRFR